MNTSSIWRGRRRKEEKEGRGSVERRKWTDMGGVYLGVGGLSPMNCSLSEKI